MDFINTFDLQDDAHIRYIFHKVVQTIFQLHQAGIAHRDIKLENIMINDASEIKVIDLGYH